MIHHRVFPLKHFVCLCAQVDHAMGQIAHIVRMMAWSA
jgi:hypothetical protein